LRIKALALLDAGGPAKHLAARDLLLRVLREYPDSLDVVIAHERLGELYESEGASDDAEAHYREALHLSLEGNVQGDANLRLPELLISSGQADKLADAEAVLATIDVERDLAFASQRFRYAVCRARLAAARHSPDEASDYAAEALRLASTSRPDFARHPTVGRVVAAESLIREMQRLAAHK
jgi:tetratricopeptide (TPR) repeat protein